MSCRNMTMTSQPISRSIRISVSMDKISHLNSSAQLHLAFAALRDMMSAWHCACFCKSYRTTKEQPWEREFLRSSFY